VPPYYLLFSQKIPLKSGTSGENNLILDELRTFRHSLLSFYGFGSVLDLRVSLSRYYRDWPGSNPPDQRFYSLVNGSIPQSVNVKNGIVLIQ